MEVHVVIIHGFTHPMPDNPNKPPSGHNLHGLDPEQQERLRRKADQQAKQKAVPRKMGKKIQPKKQPISRGRKIASNLITLSVAVIFVAVVLLIVEARHSSFYGEPLFEKMSEILEIKIHGLPENAEKRARVVTGISSLMLLPPEAVLPQAPAERFKRVGTQFGFVTSDTKLGTKYICRTSNIDQIPTIAINIAIGLDDLPEDLLQKVKMEYIVFCGDLVTNQGRVGGFPAPPNNVMLLNLTHRTSDREIKALFFHEFYHLFEHRFKLVKDPEWLKHFNVGYHNTYEGFLRPENNEMGTGGYGFMNQYSRTHPHEDRAEIFSALMVSKKQLIRYILRSEDDMLAAKTEYVARTAKEHLGIDFGDLWNL